MTTPSGIEIDQLLPRLISRWGAYWRNRTVDKQTGTERIIPVSENRTLREELHYLTNDLCGFYLTASDEERDHIRTEVRPHRSMHNALLAHIDWTVEHKPPDWQWRGLAAASIEDNRIDFRDMYVALGKLYLEVARAGMNASDCFQKAALLSSSDPGLFFDTSMRDFLANFEKSAYFKGSIESRVSRP